MSSVADAAVDTPRLVMERVEDRWRAQSANDKLQTVADLNRGCEQLSESGVRLRHPAATDDEIQMRVFALRLGRDVMMAVYDWDPRVEGW